MGKKDNHNTLWGLIKNGGMIFLKSETTSTKGRLNFLFGIMLFLYLCCCTIKSTIEVIADKIISCFNPELVPKPDETMLLLSFILLIIYFVLCIFFVKDITELKEFIKENKK